MSLGWGEVGKTPPVFKKKKIGTINGLLGSFNEQLTMVSDKIKCHLKSYSLLGIIIIRHRHY